MLFLGMEGISVFHDQSKSIKWGQVCNFFSVFSFGYLGGNVYICSDIVTC